MKVKNRNGMLLHVPDNWPEQTLHDKGLVRVADDAAISPAPGEGDMPRRESGVSLEAMPLEELKTLARSRGLAPGRLGKRRLMELLKKSPSAGN